VLSSPHYRRKRRGIAVSTSDERGGAPSLRRLAAAGAAAPPHIDAVPGRARSGEASGNGAAAPSSARLAPMPAPPSLPRRRSARTGLPVAAHSPLRSRRFMLGIARQGGPGRRLRSAASGVIAADARRRDDERAALARRACAAASAIDAPGCAGLRRTLSKAACRQMSKRAMQVQPAQ